MSAPAAAAAVAVAAAEPEERRKEEATIVQHARTPSATGSSASLFSAAACVSSALGDITLFHELLNKAGKRFDLTVGPLIDPQTEGLDTDRLKAYVELQLPEPPDKVFHA